MARGSFNRKGINRKVSRSPKLNRALDARAEQMVNQAKNIMLEDFRDHPVSQEIKAGASASNSSRTLGGYGNLFTFIGFSAAGTNPVDAIAALIRRQSYLIKRGAKIRTAGKQITKNYRVNYASVEDINASDEARMPWESGSWIRGIEEGISSFSYYMYKNFEGSRSGKGLIAKKGGRSGGEPAKVREGSFSAMKYVTHIIYNFRRNIISGARRKSK